MAERSVYVRLRAANSQYNAEMAKSGRITKMAMGVSERAIADNSTALRELEKSATGVQGTLSKPVKPRVDTKPALRDVETLDDRLNKLTFRKTLVTVAVAGLPIAIAGVSTLGAGLAGAVAMFAAAGAGAVAFGGVATASLKRVTEARKELTQEGADRAAILATLTQAQRESLRDVDALAAAWSKFQDRTDPAVLGAMGAAMSALQAALPGLAGLVTPVASAFEDFGQTLAQDFASPGFTAFMGDLGTMSSGLLANLGKAAINAAYGVGNLMTAFSGLGGGISEGLVSLSDRFATWSEGLAGSSGFQSFMDYVSDVGPRLVSTLGDVATALLDIGQAAAPLAGPMLNVVSAIARLVSAVDAIHPMALTAAVGIGIFVAASRTIGSAMVAPTQRMRVMQRQMQIYPGLAAKSRIAFEGMAGAMGGKRGIAGAAGLGAMALTGMADTSTTAGKAVSALGSTASGALMGFSVGGPIGAAVGGGIGLLTGLSSALIDSGTAAQTAGAQNLDFASTLNQVTGAVTKSTKAMVAQQLEKQGVLKQVAGLGLDPGVAVAAAMGDPQAVRILTAALDQNIAAVNRQQSALGKGRAGIAAFLNNTDDLAAGEVNANRQKRTLLATLQSFGVQLTADQKSTLRTTAATDGFGGAADRASGKTKSLATTVQDTAAAFTTLENRLSGRADMRSYEESLDAVHERLSERRSALADVADAERAVGDAQQTAADQVKTAEEGLADAQAGVLVAQQELNDARKEGAERLRDMRLELEDASLSEEGALLSIRSARQRLREVNADPESSDLDRDEADLALREAQQRLKEVRESNADLRKEYKDQSKHGVESTDEVVAAKQGLVDANGAVDDAEKALTDAIDTGTQSIRDARQQLRALRRDLKDFALGLDEGTEAGRTNATILDAIATNAVKIAKGMRDADKRSQFMKEARRRFLNLADALGVGEKKAHHLADRLLKLPHNVAVDVNVHGTSAAERKLAHLARDRRIKLAVEVAKMPGDRTAPGLQPGISYTSAPRNRRPNLLDDLLSGETHAAGGWVNGSGVAGDKEFVVNRNAALANAGLLEAINDSGRRGGSAPQMSGSPQMRSAVHASVSAGSLERQIGRLKDEIGLLAARGGGVTFGDVYANDVNDALRRAQRKKRQQQVGGVSF